ncbi:hypothetical protein ACFONB_05935, partial [Sphingopyxis italica]
VINPLTLLHPHTPPQRMKCCGDPLNPPSIADIGPSFFARYSRSGYSGVLQMGLSRAIIDWTDGIAAQGVSSRGLLFFPMLPWMLVAAHRSMMTIIVASILSLATLAFVTWRYFVVMKAQAVKNDRAYDEDGKFKLASEYHQSESATAAAERKREGRH